MTSVKGVYRDGQIELMELPEDVRKNTPVIVTFIDSDDVDLDLQGISPRQAAELRSALAAFEDWDSPEMDIYDDYDAAKSGV